MRAVDPKAGTRPIRRSPEFGPALADAVGVREAGPDSGQNEAGRRADPRLSTTLAWIWPSRRRSPRFGPSQRMLPGSSGPPRNRAKSRPAVEMTAHFRSRPVRWISPALGLTPGFRRHWHGRHSADHPSLPPVSGCRRCQEFGLIASSIRLAVEVTSHFCSRPLRPPSTMLRLTPGLQRAVAGMSATRAINWGRTRSSSTAGIEQPAADRGQEQACSRGHGAFRGRPVRWLSTGSDSPAWGGRDRHSGGHLNWAVQCARRRPTSG